MQRKGHQETENDETKKRKEESENHPVKTQTLVTKSAQRNPRE